MSSRAQARNLDIGGKYVQETQAEVVLWNLRLLSKSVRGFDENRLVKTTDFLSKHVSEKHQSIVYKSLFNYLSVYCPQFQAGSETRPLWLDLVRDNASSRQFSPSWKDNVDRLFMAFGVPTTAELYKDVNDLHLLYQLGLYDEVIERAKDEGQAQFWRLKIASLSFSENEYLDSVASLNLKDFYIEALFKGLYAVKANQSGREISAFAKFFDVEKIIQWTNWESEIDKCRYIQLLNSMNYCLIKTGNVDLSLEVLTKVCTVIDSLENEKTKAHLRGICHFHRSALIFDPSEKILDLKKAMKYDFGFFDYEYKLAVLLHNQGDIRAKDHYEQALQTSPFTLEIVNDYGCFLQENASDECQSFENMVLGTGLYSEEDFT